MGMISRPDCNYEPYFALESAREALNAMTLKSDATELLLGELRHRVKNNLQTIQSLLRIRKTMAQSPDTRKELGQIEMHIAALIGVDGDLILNSNSPVLLSEYLRCLVGKLKTVFGDVVKPICFRLDLDDMEASASVAANLGLLVNEAITNSVKHAVPRGATVIEIGLAQDSKDALLSMSDDGPGFSQDRRGHLGGAILMQRLVQRLNATMERDVNWPGTRYLVRIPRQLLDTRII